MQGQERRYMHANNALGVYISDLANKPREVEFQWKQDPDLEINKIPLSWILVDKAINYFLWLVYAIKKPIFSTTQATAMWQHGTISNLS